MRSYTDFIVNYDTIKNNAKNIKERLQPKVKLCAVVKANAYGHGVEVVCKALDGYADFFAVANILEAVRIRSFDKKTKILILGTVEEEGLEYCAKNNISVSIGSLEKLERCVKSLQGVCIHLQVNTGLNRYGFRSMVEFKKALSFIKNNGLILEGVYSHFATKENDKLFIKRQNYKFLQFKKVVKDEDVIFHIANSFATTCGDKYHYDMVRMGFLMYGNIANDYSCEPAVEIVSKIINIINVRKGESIGYDRTFFASKQMKIAVVPVGYADGFNRGLSNNFSVLICGKLCKIVGLICMDVFMVDISDIDAKIGSRVTLLGADGGKNITLFDYAKTLNTSPYAILLGFNYSRMNYIVINE